MAESACLVHSFSFSATLSHESPEDNPLHALSQSISFGRFMTESLEWGKWSSFSHKKYVEEAEKYSKPGSVAQKKAFFEAHYKKIAAAKKAAADALLEQEASNDTKASPNGSEMKFVQKQELNEQNSETGLVSGANGADLKTEKDDEPERKSVQMDDPKSAEEAAVENLNLSMVGSLNKSTVMDDEKAVDVLVPDGVEQKQNYAKVHSLKKNGLIGEDDGELLKKKGSVGKKDEIGELLKKNGSVGNKGEGRKSMSKNSLVHILSEKTSASLKTPDLVAEHPLSKQRSKCGERIAHDSVKKMKNHGLSTQTKSQDQGMTRKKGKPEKKPKKSFWCLCFKPQVLEETEYPINQKKRVQTNTKSLKH